MIKSFFLALVLMVLIDAVWLNIIAKPLYWKAYENFLKLNNGSLEVVYWSAILVYILLSLGISVFCMPLSHNKAVCAILYGAIFGAITYGVYDFTCLAIFKEWPVTMSFIDWAWGMILCAVTNLICVLLLPDPLGY